MVSNLKWNNWHESVCWNDWNAAKLISKALIQTLKFICGLISSRHLNIFFPMYLGGKIEKVLEYYGLLFLPQVTLHSTIAHQKGSNGCHTGRTGWLPCWLDSGKVYMEWEWGFCPWCPESLRPCVVGFVGTGAGRWQNFPVALDGHQHWSLPMHLPPFRQGIWQKTAEGSNVVSRCKRFIKSFKNIWLVTFNYMNLCLHVHTHPCNQIQKE